MSAGGTNPKGYNNPNAWQDIEKSSQKIIHLDKPQIIDTEKDAWCESSEDVEQLDVLTSTESESEDSNESWDDVLRNDVLQNFDEVLQLTQYEGGGLSSTRNTGVDFIVAEYEKIDTENISKSQEVLAKRIVSKITKFVLDFNDVVLTDAHKGYIKDVGNLQLENLKDLLTLVAINRQMINNIIARVNATQAEDYAIINSYNNLINQQLKLIKELTTMYKSIPSVMKKMRADVLTNQELENNGENQDEVVTEDYGESQFNNSKQLLKSILQKKESSQ